MSGWSGCPLTRHFSWLCVSRYTFVCPKMQQEMAACNGEACIRVACILGKGVDDQPGLWLVAIAFTDQRAWVRRNGTFCKRSICGNECFRLCFESEPCFFVCNFLQCSGDSEDRSPWTMEKERINYAPDPT